MEKGKYILTKEELVLLKKLNIAVVDADRNYWFVRTQGGEYFDDFYFDSYVSIEWDLIKDLELIRDEQRTEELKEKISEFYPDCKQPGAAATNLQRFVKHIKRGDVVIIPNKNSERLAFGEVLSERVYFYSPCDDEYNIDTTDDEMQPMLTKRLDVRWTHLVKRKDLDPSLYKIIYSHNTIVDAKPYELFIDRTLHNFYVKGDDGYFTYKVNKKENIPYGDFYKLFDIQNKLIQYINKKYPEICIDMNDLTLRVNVQSKGPIQISGAIKKMLFVGLVGIIIFGGEVKISFVDGLELSTDGLVGCVRNICDIKKEMEELKKDWELAEVQVNADEIKQKLEIQVPELGQETNVCEEFKTPQKEE